LRGSVLLARALCRTLQARTREPVELLETHISWVLLAGEHAYKLKKPVRLPFVHHLSALIASSAEISTLSRNIHHLTALLRQGAALFGREPYTGIDPGQAVALGAAIQADQLAGNRAGDDDLLAQSTTLLRPARWASVIVLRRASSLPVRA
jgi:hypothetical protein